MDKDSKFTRDEEGYIAVRVVSGTEALPAADKDYMFARDTNGNIAVRVVGAGGGDQHNMGYFATPAALAEAYPTAEAGDYAIVGSTDTVWIWDEDNSEWVDSDRKGQVTSVNNQTGAVSLGINDVAPTQTGKSGYVLGTDGFVAGWVKPEIVQRSTMPQASEDELGNVYQFVGTTDANYTNGYFYKCVSDGAVTPTYSWTAVEVQASSGGLPSQTGHGGEFLTTDGTDASWGNKINFLRLNNYYFLSTKISAYSGDSYLTIGFSSNDSIGVGWTFYSMQQDRYFYFENNIGGASIYKRGNLGKPNRPFDAVYTLKINNGADINVPATGGTLALTSDLPSTPSTMPELTVAGWSSNTQTVTVTGVTATNTVFVSPAPASASDYASAGIICTAQGTDSLTFTCTTVPANAITVNVVIMG